MDAGIDPDTTQTPKAYSQPGLVLVPSANVSLSPVLAQRLPFPAYRCLGYKQGSYKGNMHECILGTYFMYDVFMEGRFFFLIYKYIYWYGDVILMFIK